MMMKSPLWGLLLSVALMGVVPVSGQEGAVVLNPGTVSGSVSVIGRQISSITVYAIDTEKVYSGTVTVNVSPAKSSIDYVLTVEGDRDYYLMAAATVSAADYTQAFLPVTGPVHVPIGVNVPWGLSMEPATISGTISTGSNDNTIESFNVYAYLTIPQFDDPPYYDRTYASGLNIPGGTGRRYSLLLAPGVACTVSASVSVDDVSYSFYDYGVTAPGAGGTATRDYLIDTSAASITGTALLQGIDVYSASIYGYASPPTRSNSVGVPDVSTGSYTLDVDAGAWRLYPTFYFHLPGDLSGLTGYLSLPYSAPINVSAGDQITGVDFLVAPGFIPGTLSLWGANTEFKSAQVRAYQYGVGGYAYSYVAPDDGAFLFVCSPGNWQTDYYQSLSFDYPDDPDPSLSSSVWQSRSSGADLMPVGAGQVAPSVTLTYGTITVRRIFYVAGGGTLSRPSIRAIRHESPYSEASGYGSYSPTTEGQAIVTLLLPGTYTIEAFAYVNGSNTEFASVDVTVDEGDVVVIGGSDRPTVQLTNPTSNETVCGKKATVEGTITDDHGIASITINGEEVDFDPSENPVHFSHEVVLTLGENEITIVVTDTDQTEPVVLKVTVFSKDCGNPCPVVTITNPIDGQTVHNRTITVEGTATDDVGIASVKINGEEVPFEPVENGGNEEGQTVRFRRQVGLDCGENVITIVVSDLDESEPTVTEVTVTNTDCSLQVPIDVYPNRTPNKIYLSTDYTIYVALFGAESFAVTSVDSSTVRFGPTGTQAGPVRPPTILDLNGDGFNDAMYGFLTFDCGFAPGDTTGRLTGKTTGGTAIEGSDSVSVLP